MSCNQQGVYALGPLYFRPFELRQGDVIDGHIHNFDHVTFVTHGRIAVVFSRPDGTTGTREYRAGAEVLIRRDTTHEIRGLDPWNAGKCVYTHRDPTDGAVVQEYNGWEPAYL